MSTNSDYSELVKQARLGRQVYCDELAALARPRLYAYVYRMVLDEHAAQDIVQETMLEMFRILGKLEDADRFWPWLRGIALNKIMRHHRGQSSRRTSPLSNGTQPQASQTDCDGGRAGLIGDEIRQIVLAAMRELKPRHRRVLTMRCYEQMHYSEIADLMGCSELGVRVLFCRGRFQGVR